jgi:hypothetical protein
MTQNDPISKQQAAQLIQQKGPMVSQAEQDFLAQYNNQ